MRKLTAVFLVEALNAAGAVNQLLLAGVEGVAFGADINGEIALGGAGLDDIAASAFNGTNWIIRMSIFFHLLISQHLSVIEHKKMEA